jgi:predicted nucleic acid-binding protein
MEWLRSLYGQSVGLDAAPLIYFIEEHPVYFRLVEPFFAAVEQGDVQVVTSMLTVTEVLVHPYRYGNQRLAEEYSDILLRARNVSTFPVSPEIAMEAARLRAWYGIRTPDAIQLATAQEGIFSVGPAKSRDPPCFVHRFPHLPDDLKTSVFKIAHH